MKPEPVPDAYQGVTPYLCVDGAAGAIEFYKKAFGATELFRLADPNGKIGHAELRLGRGRLMISDEYPDWGVRGPASIGGSPVTLQLYVEDVDAVAKTFVAAGGKEVRPVENQFYGDRGGKFEDPFGHVWWIATHQEDVSPEEMKARAAKQFGTA